MCVQNTVERNVALGGPQLQAREFGKASNSNVIYFEGLSQEAGF